MKKIKEKRGLINHENLLELLIGSYGYFLDRTSFYVFQLLFSVARRKFSCFKGSWSRDKLYLVPAGGDRSNGHCDYWGVVVFWK